MRGIITIVKERRWKWLAHACHQEGRSSNIIRVALHWTPDNGKRKRERPVETWTQTIDGEIKKIGEIGERLRRVRRNEREMYN